MRKYITLLALSLLTFGCSSDDDTNSSNTTEETMYFPPNDGSNTWETKSISSLGWNQIR